MLIVHPRNIAEVMTHRSTAKNITPEAIVTANKKLNRNHFYKILFYYKLLRPKFSIKKSIEAICSTYDMLSSSLESDSIIRLPVSLSISESVVFTSLQ